ncbi:hypothetical protein EPN28_00625 [Patescibacteria group bacterium]|nr:MAG: hypothetical protein EPN28_00625 [Patescibacteria group bacterium]
MRKIIILLFLVSLFAFAAPVFSADVNKSVGADISNQFQAAGGQKGAGYGEPVDPRITAAGMIRIMLSLVGLLMVVIIIYAGVLWMTAGGNDEQVTKAKKWMFNSVIGLIIILAAWSITTFAIKLALNRYEDINQSGVYIQPNYQPESQGLDERRQ